MGGNKTQGGGQFYQKEQSGVPDASESGQKVLKKNKGMGDMWDKCI